MTDQRQLIAWLKDAYTMERALQPVLQNHARDAGDFPEIRSRLELHLQQTREHAEKVAECLRLVGEEPSMVRDLAGSALGLVEGSMSAMFRDELLKNALSDYAMEHMEVACYTALVTAAQDLGRHDIADLCLSILAEEQEMADWLLDHLPEVTRLTLHRTTAV